MFFLIILSISLVFLLMVFAFIIAYIKQDNTVADTAWGLGFIIAALASFLHASHYQPAGYLATLLVTLWGLRLIVHISLRNKGKGEDPRYKKMRAQWGAWESVHSFFKVFMLQGLLLLIISYQILVINANPDAPITGLCLAGLFIWITGFIFESVGDYQLYTFMKNPAHKGHIIQTGLWRYSRHPNYFGEIIMWWGIYLIACAAPWGLSAIISPITITFLLLFVSGIPMTEKMLENNPEFQEYKKRTSVLIPWFSKK